MTILFLFLSLGNITKMQWNVKKKDRTCTTLSSFYEFVNNNNSNRERENVEEKKSSPFFPDFYLFHPFDVSRNGTEENKWKKARSKEESKQQNGLMQQCGSIDVKIKSSPNVNCAMLSCLIKKKNFFLLFIVYRSHFGKYPFLVDDHKMSPSADVIWIIHPLMQLSIYGIRWKCRKVMHTCCCWYVFQWKIHVISFQVPISLFHWVCFHTVCKHLNQTSESDFDTVWEIVKYKQSSFRSSVCVFFYFYRTMNAAEESIFTWNGGGIRFWCCYEKNALCHVKMWRNFTENG